MPLLVGHDRAVAEWVSAGLGVRMAPPYTAIGVLDANGRLMGGAVFTGYDSANIDITFYGPRSLTRTALRGFAAYVFGHAHCERVTARCKRSNVAMRQLMGRLGFVQEGVQRRYFGPTKHDDAVLYGMTREECRWGNAGTQAA